MNTNLNNMIYRITYTQKSGTERATRMERMGDPIVLPQSTTILTEQTILACK